MYLLVVIDTNTNEIIEKIPADHKTDKELFEETRKRYIGKDVKLKFGNIVSEEMFQKTKTLLEDIAKDYPDLMTISVDEHPEFTRLGYEINKKYKKRGYKGRRNHGAR